MIFQGNYEFRGSKSIRVTKDDGTIKENNYINIEDGSGENAKFYVSLKNDNPLSLKDLEKGEVYFFIFEYNTKYGSMMITEVDHAI